VIELLVSVNRDRGRTLVLVTHDPELAALADERIMLRDGRVVDHWRRADAAVPGI
jgi:predicted ABC-type transport system involved in lysophospholipase L1 biosynthesis ATPase subunit